MPRARSDRTALAFDALTVEGALVAPAMLARIALQQADGQSEADYGVPKGLTMRDEIARYFRIGQAIFKELTASETPSMAATTSVVEKLLRDVFGFADIRRAGTRTVGDRQFTLTLEAVGGRVPVVVVPPADDLDRPSAQLTTEGRRRPAASALQDWLNAADSVLWGLASNSTRLRLTRDNVSLTRPAYIEADLRRIFEADLFADFAALWLLMHASRFGAAGTPPADCALERWREAGLKEGVAARDKLRDGVEAALISLGNGFLSHGENGALREKLQKGTLPLSDFFGQLLRLVYRLIFLFAAEDRNLLHPPDVEAAARKLYADGYSLAALRERAVRRAAWDRHHDRWEGLLIVFRALARGEKVVGLPALGGLFAADAIPDLGEVRLANRHLMEAIFRLAWLREASGLVPVNWRDLEIEELGSVYESLLELTPLLVDDGRGFAFAEAGEAKGHARKTTGSYYTPDSLVQALLDSALNPVLDRIDAEAEDPASALLSMTVLDPACGSGHFLLAAARRIATRVARARAGGVASPADYRHALRDVARACIHGVDRNPMAVELTKVALWIETLEPGKPLGFLDANIRCGDALLGVFDLEVLVEGIPDAAYKPLAGDDKEAAKIAGRINREQREGAAQQELALAQGVAHFADAARAVALLPEDDLAAVEVRARAYQAVHGARGWWATKTACDLHIAAFLAPKHFRAGALIRAQSPDHVPTTLDVHTALTGRQPDAQLVANAVELAIAARVFHWPLEFPAQMTAANGRRRGFDVVVGNPPWERIKLQEQEFFAAREPEIARAANAAARGRLITKLKDAAPGTRERRLYEEFEAARRAAEASSVLVRLTAEDGGRFPMTGRGDVNTYALFAELSADLTSKRGRAGVIVPTGIATDAMTAPFFAALVTERRLGAVFSFENEEMIFPAVHHAMKFCLLIMKAQGDANPTDFVFFARQPAVLSDANRRFTLSSEDMARLNPNTKTAPVFRSCADAELTAKIYTRVPILVEEGKGAAGNLWGISFLRMLDMANDSGLFRTAAQLREASFVRDGKDWRPPKAATPREEVLALRSDDGGAPCGSLERYVPLYEAKMIHQFDHRWATFDGTDSRDTSETEKTDVNYESTPRYWVQEREVADRLSDKGWTRGWLLGWRDITNATNERTVVAAAFPRLACGDTLLLIFPTVDDLRLSAALAANLCSLSLDYSARQKIGGTHLKYNIFKQLSVLPPFAYTAADLDFIVSRTLELTYTSYSMTPFARDMGYRGSPFAWNEDRRAHLRAELDAWYARAYGLTRDELRYILDPADTKGPDYPSETFRVLKKNEIARFGEYRTARLVLAAYDQLTKHPLAAE